MAMMAQKAGCIGEMKVCIEVGMSNLNVVKVDLERIMVSCILNAIQCRLVF